MGMDTEILCVKQILIGPMMNFAYIVADKSTREAAIIDPGWEANRLISEVKKEGFFLRYILATHTHFDHVGAVLEIARKGSAKIFVHTEESGAFDGSFGVQTVNEGDRIKVGSLDVEVLHTPGHSPGSVCYIVDHALFPGDTLFIDSIGRTDLEGGNIEEMYKSLSRLRQLPDGMVVFPGHHYGPRETATIGEQKKTNIYLAPRSLSDFMRIA